MRRIVIDLDNTIAGPKADDYADCRADLDVVRRLREYKALGFEIVIHSSRNMRTYENNLGKITANTVPVIVDWLTRHNVPYDEIWVGKPWCGTEGFYVDDRAIRPGEFKALTYSEIGALLEIAGAEGQATPAPAPGVSAA